MADSKKSLFGMDSDDLADALESIYKKQRDMASDIDEIKTAILAMKTSVQTSPLGGVPGEEGADDGVPPLVKWALNQPWGVQLMHTLTDQEMLGGLAKSAIDWLKQKAVQKIAETEIKP